MKRFNGLLGLCLVISLLMARPISSADPGVLSEYLFGTPELIASKVTTAGVLALAYGVHHYGKSKPATAAAGVLSLVSLYLAYNDISLVKEAQSIRNCSVEDASDDQIVDWMDSLCFNRSYESCVGLSVVSDGDPNSNVVRIAGNHPIRNLKFKDFDLLKKAKKEFFEKFASEEGSGDRLRGCGETLLRKKGFKRNQFKSYEQYIPLGISKDNVKHNYIISLLTLEKIINGFQEKEIVDEDRFFSYNEDGRFLSYAITIDINKLYDDILQKG